MSLQQMGGNGKGVADVAAVLDADVLGDDAAVVAAAAVADGGGMWRCDVCS